MSSRHRQSAARPAHSRPSGATASSSSRPTIAPSLPPYKKPSYPLTPAAQHKLRRLKGGTGSQTSFARKELCKKAEENITQIAGTINDQLRDREERVARRRKKWEQGHRVEEQEAEERGLKELHESVDQMTRRLEEGMRAAIDAGEAAQRLDEVINWLRDSAPGQLQNQYDTQMSQQPTQSQSQRRQRRHGDGEDGENGEDEQEEDSSPGPTPLTQNRVTLTGLGEMFSERLDRKKNEYTSFSHGARYAKNNSYIGFKAMVHDAKYGDDGPPMPHADTWFTEHDSPAPGITATQGDADDDDDIIMDRATVSTRCPLTFQQFKDPYTSKKCPHTFEKNAILEFIRRSQTRIGGNGRGPGERAIQCPVNGCDEIISASDLYEDVVLVRKIKRMQAAEAQGAEDSEPEDDDVQDEPRTFPDGSGGEGGWSWPEGVKAGTKQ
ncbi:hypothetical protein K491DRAFT_159985 [Lophiostoma macrostomum CBS 122681]|uniref:SP-RING-type domain-containing protein n=1 Tax=Lophiostoma macrostomum CBS 122681 TaxID=1314788 RepID=A0A6A6STW3_9PLEO|nr:hypothetical protein K491DRAFT_159985 [Lophiostoma macrostomum CBS 122681]